MPFKDFDAARKEAERENANEVIQFTLGGETFTCMRRVPLAFSFELMEAPDYITGGAGVVHQVAKFLRRILIDDENAERFDALLARREDAITGDDILTVGTWLGGLYGGRPLENAEDSTDSSSTNGHVSKPASSEVADDLSWTSASEK